MAKRYRKNKGGEGGLIIIGLIIAFAIFLIKIILYLIPIALFIYIIYQYSLWHEKRLKFYNNNFDEFYQKELKYKLQISLAILICTTGFIIFFIRPIIGFLILLVGLFFIPSIDNFLTQKFRENYNLKIKGLAIASLIATSLYSNHYYNNQAAIKFKEDEIIQKELEKEKKLNEEILSKKTDSLNNYLDLADKELAKNNLSKAKKNIEKAKALSINNDRIFVSEGVLYEKSKNYKEAINTFLKIQNDSYNYSDAQYHIGYCYLNSKEKDNALGYLKEASNLNNKKASKLYFSLVPKPKIVKQNFSGSQKRKKRNTGVRYASKVYIRGPRGGCYYINSNGNKTYVDRSLCN